MNSDQKCLTHEDSDLACEVLHRSARAAGTIVEGPDDDEPVILEFLELGEVLGIQAVHDRRRVQPVGPRYLLELGRCRLNHVQPDERRLGALKDGTDAHRRGPAERSAAQMRLAATAAPNPLSIFTT